MFKILLDMKKIKMSVHVTHSQLICAVHNSIC
jgi:hypothetical protein